MAIDFNAFKIPGINNDTVKNPKPEHDEIDETAEANPLDANMMRAAKAIKTIPYHKMIRMISDKNIENLLPWHFEQGGGISLPQLWWNRRMELSKIHPETTAPEILPDFIVDYIAGRRRCNL